MDDSPGRALSDASAAGGRPALVQATIPASIPPQPNCPAPTPEVRHSSGGVAEAAASAWVARWTVRLEEWGAGRWLSALRWVRKGLVLVLGASVVAVGLVLLVTPGPAFLVIPAGLAILATEFYWARRVLLWMRHRASEALARGTGNKSGEAARPAFNHESVPGSGHNPVPGPPPQGT